jgi:tripartite-type tricarboxylate transporter receptor subunit TctC
MQRRRFLQACAATPWLAAGAARAADGYPSRPIRMLIGYAAGGTADISWRIIAPILADRLGQPVVIENKPGAGGIVASQAALAAPADGYTFLLAATGNFGISPVLLKSMPYDAVKDFEMIAQVADFGYVFAVASNSPFKNVRDVVAYARQHPGKLSIGTVQVGSAQFFAAELFKSMAGISAVTVPYRTSGDVVAATRSGDVQLMVETIAPVISQVKGGALRALGVTDDAPFPSLPGVPPISRDGVPDYVVKAWNGLAARAGTPRTAAQRMGRELSAVLAMDEVKQRYIDLGIIAKYGTPETARALQLADIKKWSAVMASAHLEKQ